MHRKESDPRWKGKRQAILARVPEGHWEVYEEQRREAGYKSLSDYIVAVLAERHELDVPAYAQPTQHEEGLLDVG